MTLMMIKIKENHLFRDSEVVIDGVAMVELRSPINPLHL